MNPEEENAAHVVVDKSGNIVAVTLNAATARQVKRYLASGLAADTFSVRHATLDDAALVARRVNDDL